MQTRAVHSHIIASHAAIPLMIARGSGLIIEITDGEDLRYRGSLFYDLAKISAIRLAFALSKEFRARHLAGLSSVALTPGFLRSEAMLDIFGVTEANWRDAVHQDPHFAQSETPHYIGQAVVSLASDPNVTQKTGQALATGDLAREYGFTDVDGSQPQWSQYFRKHFPSS